MRKHMAAAIVIAVLTAYGTGCNEGNNDNPSTAIRTSQFDGIEGDCTSGGVKIEFLVNGAVYNAQTQ